MLDLDIFEVLPNFNSIRAKITDKSENKVLSIIRKELEESLTKLNKYEESLKSEIKFTKDEMITPSDAIKTGKKVMLQCEVVEDYESNCVVKVKLPNGKEEWFHLNNFLSHDLQPYISWEYDG